MDHEFAQADTIVNDLFEEADPITIGYSVWVNLIHVLVAAGWTEQELTKDLIWHVRQQETH